MPQFALPNIQTGGSQTITANTLQDAQNIAQSQGTWNSGAGTYGANSILGGGGATTGAGSAPGVSAPGSVSGTDLSGLATFGAQTSGVTQASLSQQYQEFEQQLQFAKDQMTQLGIPQLQINQFLAQMQQQQFQSQLALAQQAQAYNQAATTAGLTGYWNAPSPVPSVQQYLQPGQPALTNPLGTGNAAMEQNQYVNARVQQLQGHGYSAAQAQQTATAEYSQGFAQNGNVAFGLPSGFTFNTPGAAAAATSIGSWQPPTQQDYVTARTAQLQQMGWDAQKAAQTAYAEATMYWPQVQQGNVAGGLPTGISFTAPAGSTPSSTGGATGGGTAGGGAAGGTAASLGTPTLAAQAQWAQLFGTNGPPAAGQQTLADILQNATLTGMYNGAPTEAAREFNANLGQQYLATASQLQGPQNTFQLSNYLRGAQGNQSVPLYLQNLAQGVGQNLFTAPGSTAPTPQSAAGLAGQLGGTTSATPGWDYNQTLGTIQNIMGGGAQKLAPGALENLTPDELQALGSGIGAAGGTLPSFLQQYAQSRLGQAAPVARTSLTGG